MATWKEQIKRIREAFPSFERWWQSLDDAEAEGLRHAWQRQLANLNQSDLSNAVDQFIDGHQEMPANYEYDRLGTRLRTVSNFVSQKRLSERNTEQLRDAANGSRDPQMVRCVQAMRRAMLFGALLRDGKISCDDNGLALEMCHAFHRGDAPQLPQTPIV